MDVRNCRMCGKLYNFIGGPYRNLCPNCIEKMEEKFDEVKEYIEEHKAATINEVSEECDVSSRQIEQNPMRLLKAWKSVHQRKLK